jgi:excisionase family DNA binding protein
MNRAPLHLDEDPSSYLSEDDRPTNLRNRLPGKDDKRRLPAVLSIEEVALLLRVNRKTVYDAVRRAQIPGASRIGRIIRVDRDTFLTWNKCQSDMVESRPQGRVASPGGKHGGTTR